MTSTMIPTMRDADAPRMIEGLSDPFGFERHFVVSGGSGTGAHAQLCCGTGTMMRGSARDEARAGS